MKKLAFGTTVIALAAVVVFAVFRNVSGETVAAEAEVSERIAKALEAKIDLIQNSGAAEGRKPEEMEVLETELESYVLFILKEDIPAKLETFDVQLGPGTVAADTRMTFSPNGTGNPLIDVVIAGTHDLFVKGSLAAANGKGKFVLEQVRLDGIPVPNILIESLISRYVKPKYPDVDLNEPFEMPWGIDALTISPGKVTVLY